MTPITFTSRDTSPSHGARIGAQPIALAAAILLIVVAGAASIALSRAYIGASPELDRVAAAARQLQARAAQASEQLVEKTKGLELTQQESIDQLQVIQDQLQTVRRALAAQQADSKRLSEQVSGLTEAIEGLRQSFASAQANEPASAPAARNLIRTRARAMKSAHQKRDRSRG
jgi:chromosome segregation ATPase